MRQALAHVALLLLYLIGCGGMSEDSPPPNSDAGTWFDASPLVLEQVVDQGPFIVESDNYPDGEPLMIPWRIIDACRVCMIGDAGLSCGRREACPTPTCVLSDGTMMAAGEVLNTPWCHRCVCDASGRLDCQRSTDGDCPADRCTATIWGEPFDLGLGEERFVGECHVLRCDAVSGFSVSNVCHGGCSTPHGEVPLNYAELEPGGCAICTCTYGSFCCVGAFTCPDEGPNYCPAPGAPCTDDAGQQVPSGDYGLTAGRECQCLDGAFACEQSRRAARSSQKSAWTR
jgi:hypothetical protein